MLNGSFEDQNICTEFQQRCSPSGWINWSLSIPILINTYAGDGKPLDGERFIKTIGANSKTPGVRTFITSRLLCGLRQGSEYNIELYYRFSDPLLDSIGIYFSSTDFLYENRSFKDINPSIWITKNDVEEPKGTWIKKSCVFTATGKENYFTIGIFKRDDFIFNSPTTKEQDIYLYLDKLTMVPANNNERICASADSTAYVVYKQHDRHSNVLRRRLSFLNNPLPKMSQPKTIVLQIDTLTITDISFKSGVASLNNESLKRIDSFIGKINSLMVDSIVVEGHTDSIGNYQYNQPLSADRSSSVLNYIQSKLALSPRKGIIHFFADKRPVASNRTLEGRQRNRRVEIFVYRRL